MSERTKRWASFPKGALVQVLYCDHEWDEGVVVTPYKGGVMTVKLVSGQLTTITREALRDVVAAHGSDYPRRFRRKTSPLRRPYTIKIVEKD